jgi:hypothetical protein
VMQTGFDDLFWFWHSSRFGECTFSV